jgi:hypothetical protein
MPRMDGFSAAQGLHGLAAAQGLHGLAAAQGLHGLAAAQGLQGPLAQQGLHGFGQAVQAAMAGLLAIMPEAVPADIPTPTASASGTPAVASSLDLNECIGIPPISLNPTAVRMAADTEIQDTDHSAGSPGGRIKPGNTAVRNREILAAGTAYRAGGAGGPASLLIVLARRRDCRGLRPRTDYMDLRLHRDYRDWPPRTDYMDLRLHRDYRDWPPRMDCKDCGGSTGFSLHRENTPQPARPAAPTAV